MIGSPDPGSGAVLPYLSNVVMRSGVAYLAGHVPLDGNGELLGTDARTQAQAVVDGLADTLATVGMTLADVTTTTVYLKSRQDRVAVNQVYIERFPAPPPARTTIQAELMDSRFLVEISAVACR